MAFERLVKEVNYIHFLREVDEVVRNANKNLGWYRKNYPSSNSSAEQALLEIFFTRSIPSSESNLFREIKYFETLKSKKEILLQYIVEQRRLKARYSNAEKSNAEGINLERLKGVLRSATNLWKRYILREVKKPSYATEMGHLREKTLDKLLE